MKRLFVKSLLTDIRVFKKSAISHSYVPMPSWYTFKSLVLVYFLNPVNKNRLLMGQT